MIGRWIIAKHIASKSDWRVFPGDMTAQSKVCRILGDLRRTTLSQSKAVLPYRVEAMLLKNLHRIEKPRGDKRKVRRC